MARQVRQAIVNKQVMPKLGGDNSDQTEFDRRFLRSADLAVAHLVAPKLHGFNVKVAGFLERLGAQELIDKRGHFVVEEAVERSAKHSFGTPRDLVWQIALAEQAENVLV